MRFLRRWLWGLLSHEVWRRVVWLINAHVSEVPADFLFSVEIEIYLALKMETAGVAFQKTVKASRSPNWHFKLYSILFIIFCQHQLRLIFDGTFKHRVGPVMSLWLPQDVKGEGVAIWLSVQCGLPLIEFTMTFSLCASKRPFKRAGFLFTTPLFLFHPLVTASMLP